MKTLLLLALLIAFQSGVVFGNERFDAPRIVKYKVAAEHLVYLSKSPFYNADEYRVGIFIIEENVWVTIEKFSRPTSNNPEGIEMVRDWAYSIDKSSLNKVLESKRMRIDLSYIKWTNHNTFCLKVGNEIISVEILGVQDGKLRLNIENITPR